MPALADLIPFFATPVLAASPEETPGVFGTPAEGFVVALTTLVIFLVLLYVLSRYAWGPISSGLIKREEKIREDIAQAERSRADAERSRLDYQQQIEGADQRIRDLLAQAQADGQQLATRLRMQAQEEAEEIKERAVRDIEQSRREATEQIRREAAELATLIAEKILRREVGDADQQRLIDASLDELATVSR